MTVTDGDTENEGVTDVVVVTVTDGVNVVDWVTVTEGDTENVAVTDADAVTVTEVV